jgi:hypothetical protein
MRVIALVLVAFVCALTGCSGFWQYGVHSHAQPTTAVAVSGFVRDGQKPMSGAHVYLFAANTTGYGQASVSLLDAAFTKASDAIGAYVLSDSTGSFSIPTITCGSNSQLYLYS